MRGLVAIDRGEARRCKCKGQRIRGRAGANRKGCHRRAEICGECSVEIFRGLVVAIGNRIAGIRGLDRAHDLRANAARIVADEHRMTLSADHVAERTPPTERVYYAMAPTLVE